MKSPPLTQTKLSSFFPAPTPRRPPSPPIIPPAKQSASSSSPQPPPQKPYLYPERHAHLPQPSSPPLPTTRSAPLALIATETKSLLPALLATTPHAPPHGHLHHLSSLPPLSPSACPLLPPTAIQVLNADTLDVALALATASSTTTTTTTTTTSPSPLPPQPPPLILNMANAQHGGGGWLRGALAQEETLCYRSSLSFTLKRRFYPLPALSAIYSPTVLVLRSSLAAGHGLLDLSRPAALPVISAVSVAAERNPDVVGGLYRRPAAREQMKAKIRMVLRLAANRGHRTLVLGALGCGAFGNPTAEVARCWREVFAEGEFAGGWWERVVFAVMGEGGRDGDGNFGVFWRGLGGVVV